MNTVTFRPTPQPVTGRDVFVRLAANPRPLHGINFDPTENRFPPGEGSA